MDVGDEDEEITTAHQHTLYAFILYERAVAVAKKERSFGSAKCGALTFSEQKIRDEMQAERAVDLLALHTAI